MILPCRHTADAPVETCRTCDLYTYNHAFQKTVAAAQKVLTKFVAGNIQTEPCRYLGKSLPLYLYRRECLKGVTGKQPLGFSSVPGVKPCADCGEGICPSYLPKLDGGTDTA